LCIRVAPLTRVVEAVGFVDASCSVIVERISPLLAVMTTTTCAVVVRFDVVVGDVVDGVVMEVDRVVDEEEEDEEDDDEDEEVVEELLEEDDELEVVDELLLTLVEVDVGVVDVVDGVVEVEILLLVVELEVVLVELEVVLVEVRLAVKLLNLGSPLDNEIVIRTVLTPSSAIVSHRPKGLITRSRRSNLCSNLCPEET
jgi:hypothetical protein